jgi:hypothetical protein
LAHPTYKLSGGKRVPSVTTVLSRFKESKGLVHWAWQQGKEGLDYNETRDRAATVGSFAHEMIEAHILGKEPECPTPYEAGLEQEEYDQMMALAGKAYFGFLNWSKATNLQIIATETSLVSEAHAFGGTPDAIGVLGGSGALVLLDWKTSKKIYADYVVQIAAYCHLWRHGHMLIDNAPPPPRFGEPVQEAHIVRVGKELGDYHHHTYPREVIQLGWEQFQLLRKAYDLSQKLEKAV